MKMNKTMTATIAAVVLATGVAVAKTNSAEVVEIVDGGMKWRFVPVVGTSKLPLEFMRTGKNREQTVSVTMPKFWIAEKMVTEGEFAAVIGRKVRANSKAEDVLSGIEWEEALEYCEKFSQKYSAQLPKDVIASIPTMIEWSHAVNIIDERTKNALKLGFRTFLFTGNVNGGFLYTSESMPALCESDFSTTFAMISKRAKRWNVGLRMVLVDISGGETFVDKKQYDNTIVSRGALLTEYGLFDQAKRLLGKVGDVKTLSEDQRKRAKEVLACANKEYECEFEDWSGIISRSAIFAEERGFRAEPFAAILTPPCLSAVGGWMNAAGAYGDEETNACIDSIIARYYQKAGIVGEWRRIGDLPLDVRKGQSELGKTEFILIEVKKDEEPYKHEYTITESNLVQVLRCDFTGDGREDMVVENYGSVGSDGYRYSFYEAKGDGTYREVEEVQLVGLCVLPRKDGKGCGFLILCKAGYPALTAHLYVFKNVELECEDVASKPFYMLDAETDRIYMRAPFIGERHGVGWRLLESCGIWFRPVYWPWQKGKVQGYKDAVKNAQETKKMKGEKK